MDKMNIQITNLCDIKKDNMNLFYLLENDKNIFKFFKEHKVNIIDDNCLLNKMLLKIKELTVHNNKDELISEIYTIIKILMESEVSSEDFSIFYFSLFIEKFLTIIKQIKKDKDI